MSSISPEIDDFLRVNTRTFLLARRKDGWPTGYPMVGLWGNGALWFNTYRKSAKIKNIERDPRVCCVVTTSDPGDRRAVLLHGTAAVVGAADFRSDGAARAEGSELTTVPGKIISLVQERLASGKRVMVRVTVERAEFAERP